MGFIDFHVHTSTSDGSLVRVKLLPGLQEQADCYWNNGPDTMDGYTAQDPWKKCWRSSQVLNLRI